MTPSVLLVEDEPSIAVTLTDDLVDSGIRVTNLASGLSAVHLLARRRFDAVITDLRLPGADGFEVARAVRRTSPQTKVLMISAHWNGCAPPTEEMQTLQKPFDNEEVIGWLRRVGVMAGRS